MRENTFRFKTFEIRQERSAMKVGTDGVLLGAWAAGKKAINREMQIMDIGSGTGLIAMMMAERFQKAYVLGIEVEHEAVEESIGNVARSIFDGRIEISEGRFEEYGGKEKYDIIVCNPPYFKDSLKCPENGRLIARHGENFDVAELFKFVRQHLKEDGVFAMIFPYDRENEAIQAAEKMNLRRRARISGTRDGKIRRTLLEFGLEKGECIEESEYVEEERGVRSEWYQKLTDKFYL
ncbi:MAG: methyltransferase [Paludibacteraceae bacterium]|nr:methyltransferase [Paludibacteraceae bacterium]